MSAPFGAAAQQRTYSYDAAARPPSAHHHHHHNHENSYHQNQQPQMPLSKTSGLHLHKFYYHNSSGILSNNEAASSSALKDFGRHGFARSYNSGSTSANAIKDALDTGAEQVSRFIEQSAAFDPLSWIDGHGDDEGPASSSSSSLFSNLRYHKVLAPVAFAYCFFQVIAVLAQFRFLEEVGEHSSGYLQALEDNCSLQHTRNGVCLGPSWELVTDRIIAFDAGGLASLDSGGGGSASAGVSLLDSSSSYPSAASTMVVPPDRTFEFETTSKPKPTFLVGVEPQSPYSHARYRLKIERKGEDASQSYVTWNRTPKMDRDRAAVGMKSGVYVAEPSGNGAGPDRWVAKLELLSLPQDAASASTSAGPSFRVYVVDSRLAHLGLIHSSFSDPHGSGQCDFIQTWERFSTNRASALAGYLDLFYYVILFFFLTQVLMLGLITWKYLKFVDGSRLLTRLAVLKFVAQDFPQQILMGLYFAGWYANDGMRCQMCLFHPEHCGGSESSVVVGDSMVPIIPGGAAASSGDPLLMGSGDDADHSHSAALLDHAEELRHSEHDAVPLSIQNIVLALSLIFSALTTQFLINPSKNKTVMSIYDSFTLAEDEKCFTVLSRSLIFAVSILPISTFYVTFSRTVLDVGHGAHGSHSHSCGLCFLLNVFFTVVCVAGWMCVFSLPMCVCCDGDGEEEGSDTAGKMRRRQEGRGLTYENVNGAAGGRGAAQQRMYGHEDYMSGRSRGERGGGSGSASFSSRSASRPVAGGQRGASYTGGMQDEMGAAI